MLGLIYFIIFVNLCNYGLTVNIMNIVRQNNIVNNQAYDGTIYPWRGNEEIILDRQTISLDRNINKRNCISTQVNVHKSSFNDNYLKKKNNNNDKQLNNDRIMKQQRGNQVNDTDSVDVSEDKDNTNSLVDDRKKRKQEQIKQCSDKNNRISNNIRAKHFMEKNIEQDSHAVNTDKLKYSCSNSLRTWQQVNSEDHDYNGATEKQMNYNSKKKRDIRYANEFRRMPNNKNYRHGKKFLEFTLPVNESSNINTNIDETSEENDQNIGNPIIDENIRKTFNDGNWIGHPVSEIKTMKKSNMIPFEHFKFVKSTTEVPNLNNDTMQNYSMKDSLYSAKDFNLGSKDFSFGRCSGRACSDMCHPSGGVPKYPKPALTPDANTEQYSQFLTGHLSEHVVNTILEKVKSNGMYQAQFSLNTKNLTDIRAQSYINISHTSGASCSPVYGELKKFLTWLVITTLRRKPRSNYYNIMPERNFLFDHVFLNPWPDNQQQKDVIALPQSLYGFQQQPMYGFGYEPYTSKLFYDPTRKKKNIDRYIYRSKIVFFPEND